MILLNKLFGMVSGCYFFFHSFVCLSRSFFFLSLSSSLFSLYSFFERKARLLRRPASSHSFSSVITDRDCVYFIRLEQKSNRYDRYLAFLSYFFLSFAFIFFVYVLNFFFFCEISTSCFHCETSNFFFFEKKRALN